MKLAKSFKDLLVWQKAHTLVLGVYKYTGSFPESEKFVLVNQMRRSAISIPANIAQGSLEELKYFILLAHDLGYMGKDELNHLAEEVSRLLEAYSKAILNSNS